MEWGTTSPGPIEPYGSPAPEYSCTWVRWLAEPSRLVYRSLLLARVANSQVSHWSGLLATDSASVRNTRVIPRLVMNTTLFFTVQLFWCGTSCSLVPLGLFGSTFRMLTSVRLCHSSRMHSRLVQTYAGCGDLATTPVATDVRLWLT